MANYSTTHNDECIFCKIAKKEFPPLGDGLIYEDENYMAWLSPFPNTKAFTVVIPKNHENSDVLKLEDKKLTEFILISKKVAKILENYFEDVGRVGLIMEGTGINHAHIKLFPMHGTGFMKTGEWRQFPSNVDTYFEKYEGLIMSNDGPKANFDELKELAKKIKDSY
jgi:histidine triad (HIT) family protein